MNEEKQPSLFLGCVFPLRNRPLFFLGRDEPDYQDFREFSVGKAPGIPSFITVFNLIFLFKQHQLYLVPSNIATPF